jgi:hypothetical protein
MVVASCVKGDAINLSVTKPEHESAAQSLRGFVMRVPGGAVLFPIIAVLLFGASLAWDQLGKIDPIGTGTIR